jgi:hypothetical protein
MAINWGCRLSDISDGCSNTMILAELRAGISTFDQRGTWAMGFPGASVVCAGHDFTDPTPNNLQDPTGSNGDELQNTSAFWFPGISAAGMGCIYQSKPGKGLNTGAQSRSLHGGGAYGIGVNSCFADGSVHFIPNTISIQTWMQLCSRDDGQTLGTDWIDD